MLTRHLVRVVGIVVLAAAASGCAAAMAYRRGDDAARKGDWDAAVVHYRDAMQESPETPEYKIAHQRASLEASRVHANAAREAEARGELDVAFREYTRAAEYDPSNRQVAAKALDLDREIRRRIEASRPKPPLQGMRERARQAQAEPALNPASRAPLNFRFQSASLKDILSFIASASGINIAYTTDYRDPPAYSVQLDGVTLEQALSQILSSNNFFYKVLNERTVLVIPDSTQNRAKFEEQVVRTFYLSHADAQEMVQLLNTILRIPGAAVIPTFVANKNANTITVRATAPLVAVMERVIEANDRPRAEILIDVQILEVNRNRAKQYGLDLSQWSVAGVFSPETAPSGGSGGATGGSTGGGTGGVAATGLAAPPFNLNTLSRGISAADFYMALPAAIVRFLETDTHTKLVAKPQLRGQEGQKIKLNLGDEIPVPQTTFGSLGGPGSIATQPISSFNYKSVGVNVEMTPRVTFEGDIVLEMLVESSSLGTDIVIAEQSLPTFGSRKVETKIRLRDGESTLLAGLLREDERRSLRGFIGLSRLPVFRQLFSSNDNSFGQTDIVILLTPRIVRSHELTQEDVDPVFIGSQQNLGLTGPPPLIAPSPGTEEGGAAPPAAPPAAAPSTPPGTLPRPGVLPIEQSPAAQAPPQAPQPATPPAAVEAAPAPTAPSEPAPPPAPVPITAPPVAEEAVRPGANVVRILVTPPGPDLRLSGGPYTFPVSVMNASRISTLSVSVVFNPAVLRVRSVQEGTYMKQGGVAATFAQQVDAAGGRVDITATRGSDVVGASGTGLLAAVIFEPVAPGTATLAASGAGTGPSGAGVTVQSNPVTVTVR